MVKIEIHDCRRPDGQFQTDCRCGWKSERCDTPVEMIDAYSRHKKGCPYADVRGDSSDA